MRYLLKLLALPFVLAGCGSTLPDAAHDFDAPPVRQVSRETITQTRVVFVATPPQDLLAWIINVPLENVFSRYGSIPAVAGTQQLLFKWPKVGARRVVLLSDGNKAAEVILTIEGQLAFTYQVWGFTNAAGTLANYSIGRFEVEPANLGSKLTWTYSFVPRSGWTKLPLSAFVATQWSGYMTQAIANLKKGAERDIAPPLN